MSGAFDLLKEIGLFTVASGAIAYLLKRYIDRSFTVKEKEIDHQNRLLEHRAQVTFSSLHMSRAEAIRTIYHRLLEFKEAALECVNKANLNDGKGGDRFALAFNTGIDIHKLVEREAIYLDQETCDLVLHVVHEYDQVFLSMQFGAGIPVPQAEYQPKLERSRGIIENEALPALKKLQGQFRKILGVE